MTEMGAAGRPGVQAARPAGARGGAADALGTLHASLLLGFAVLEAGIRVFYPRPEYVEQPIHARSADPVLLYELRPNAKAMVGQVPVETNSLGFRGPEVAAEPEAAGAQQRIVVAGDSIAFGWGVREPDAFPARMQQLLNASRADGQRPFVVFNLGVVGYNTAQDIQALKLKGLPLGPRLAFVVYCLNDPDRFTGDHVRYFHPPAIETIYYFGRAVDKLWHRWSRLDYHHYVHHRYRDDVRRNLAELARLGTATGIPIVLVIVPSFHWSDQRYPYLDIHRLLGAEAARNGLRVVDLWDDFAGLPPRSVSLDVWHPNRVGHEVIARRLDRVARSVLGQPTAPGAAIGRPPVPGRGAGAT
jgi:lysophospholipase L1-like esterase